MGKRKVWEAKSGQTTSFIYDADGNRLIQHAPDANTLYVAGQEVRLATGATSPVCTHYYSFGDQTIASRTASGLMGIPAMEDFCVACAIVKIRMTFLILISGEQWVAFQMVGCQANWG